MAGTTKNSLACGLCFFESPTESAFLSHLNVKHSRDLFFWCRWCGLLFSDRPKYAQHATGNDCAKTYQFNHPCGFEKCDFSTGNPTRFLAHFSRNHRGSSFIRCYYCKRSFTIPACLVEHIQLDCCERPAPGMYTGDSDGEINEPRAHNTSSYKGPYMQAAPTRNVTTAKQTTASASRAPRSVFPRSGSPDPDDPQPVNTPGRKPNQSTNAIPTATLYNRLKTVSIRKSRNLINFCKDCGIVLSPEKDINEHYGSGECSGKYKFIHRCGFKYCPYSTGNPQDFIAHFNRAHNGEQFLSCFKCHRSFSIPSCLVEHIQVQCAEPFPHRTDNETTTVPKPASKTVVEKPPPKQRGRTKNTANTNFHDDNSLPESEITIEQTSILPTIPHVRNIPSHFTGTINLIPNRSLVNSSVPVPVAISRIKQEPLDGELGIKIKQEPVDTCASEEIITSDIPSIPDIKVFADTSANTSIVPEPNRPSDLLKGIPEKDTGPGIVLHIASPVLPICNWNEWSLKFSSLKSPAALKAMLDDDKLQKFFKCMSSDCKFASDDRLDFSFHILMNHKDEIMTCGYCFFTHSGLDFYLDHICNLHSFLTHQCSLCFYRGCSSEHVEAHCKRFHINKAYKVFACSRIMPSYDVLNVALQLHRTYNCTSNNCDFRTVIKKEFQKHWQDQHPESTRFSCCYCSLESNTLETLVLHYSTHNIHDFECDYCPFGSDKVDSVIDHVCINHANLKLQMLNRLSDFQKPGSTVSNLPQLPDTVTSSTDFVQSASKPESERADPANLGSLPSSTSTGDCGVAIKQEPLSDSESCSEVDNSPSVPISSTKGSVGDSDLNAQEKEAGNLSTNVEVAYLCLKCDIQSKSYLLAEAHAKNTHQLEDFYKCSHCTFNSSDKFSIKLHLKVAHPNTTAYVINLAFRKLSIQKGSSGPKIKYQCNMCTFNCYNTSFAMLQHVSSFHSSEPKYKCATCTFSSASENVVEIHSKTFHDKNHADPINVSFTKFFVDEIDDSSLNSTSKTSPRSKSSSSKYTCVFCNYGTSKENDMVTHLYMEVNYFKYFCNHCNFRGRLSIHVMTHCKNYHPGQSMNIGVNANSSIELWVKDYVFAQRQKSDGEGVIAPCLLDSNFQRNYCYMCQLKFESEILLQEHIYRHLQYHPYYCTVCDKHFINSNAVEEHQIQEHAGKKGSQFKPIKIIEDWVTKIISQSEKYSGGVGKCVSEPLRISSILPTVNVHKLDHLPGNQSENSPSKLKPSKVCNDSKTMISSPKTKGTVSNVTTKANAETITLQEKKKSSPVGNKRGYNALSNENQNLKKSKLDYTDILDKDNKNISELKDQDQEALACSQINTSATSAPSTSRGFEQVVPGNLKSTSRKSTTKFPHSVKTARKSLFQNNLPEATARKSFCASATSEEVRQLYPSRYGCQPEIIDYSSLYIVTKPHGFQTYVNLSVFYLQDLFKRKPVVMLVDCKESVLASL